MTALRGTELPPEDERGYGMFTRFTTRARAAVELARQRAITHRHNYLGTEHLLLGVPDEGTNLAVKVLEALDVEPADLTAELEASLGPAGPKATPTAAFTLLVKQAMEEANNEALRQGHNYLGCEHLLLGLLATEEGLASQVLRRMGLDLRLTRQAVATALSGFLHAQHAIVAQPPSRPAATLDDVLRRLEAIEQRLPE